MIRMKALKSFGVQGSNEGPVRHGREFDVANESRARDLEAGGLAFRVATRSEPPPRNKMEEPPQNQMEVTPENKEANPAAETGPFDSAGGQTGEATQQSSSPPAPQQGRRPSGRSRGG